MTDWLILGAWILGVLLTWRHFAIGILEAIEREYPELPLDGGDRAMAVWAGTLLALGWPVALPGRALWKAVTGSSVLQTSREKQRAQEKELAELRRMAREHGLPMPGDPS